MIEIGDNLAFVLIITMICLTVSAVEFARRPRRKCRHQSDSDKN